MVWKSAESTVNAMFSSPTGVPYFKIKLYYAYKLNGKLFSSPTGVPYFKIINRGNARRLADLGFRPLLGFLISKCLCALTTHTPAASFRPLLGFLISKLAELPEDKRLEFQFSSPTGVPYFKMSKLLEY